MAILGMRGLGDFSDAERPTNFREALLREYPQGGAVFTMILGMLKNEAVDDVKYTIFEQGLPQQEFVIESASGGSDNSDDTTFVLDDSSPVVNDYPANSWKPGMLGRIESTNEIFYVSAVSPPDDLTVIRGIGNSGTGIIFTDGAACSIIGPCDKEGADTPSAISYDPSTRYNYIQTFRTALTLTDDAAHPAQWTFPDVNLAAGQFPEGTVLLKELQLTMPGTHSDGSRVESSGRGYFPAARNGIDISVKDSKRFNLNRVVEPVRRWFSTA